MTTPDEKPFSFQDSVVAAVEIYNRNTQARQAREAVAAIDNAAATMELGPAIVAANKVLLAMVPDEVADAYRRLHLTARLPE